MKKQSDIELLKYTIDRMEKIGCVNEIEIILQLARENEEYKEKLKYYANKLDR